jgi:glycosyltransferase involved in cell wall biosynthesis
MPEYTSAGEVTFLIASLRGGGSERVCVTLANALAKSGWQVNLVVLTLEGAVYAADVDPAVNLRSLGRMRARSSIHVLLRYLRAEKPVTVLVFNHQLAAMLIVIRKLARLKFSIVSRSINTLSEARSQQRSFWHRYMVHAVVRSAYPFVDLVIAQSEGMRLDLLRNYGLGADQVVKVHNPVAESVLNEADEAPSVVGRQSDRFILCVGRLEPQKGTQFALQAFAGVCRDLPGLRLKIIGKGSLESSLRQMCAELNISHLVDFEGFRSDIGRFYKRASVTVLTSLYEGFPNVLVESISVGTPVVAFDCPHGPREIIVEGINGYLVSMGDMNTLQQVITKTLESEWDSARIVGTAQQFSVSRVAEQYAKRLSGEARVGETIVR